MKTLLILVLSSVIHINSARYSNLPPQVDEDKEAITYHAPFYESLNTISDVNKSNSTSAYDNNFHYFQNRWKSDKYIHVEYGKVEDGGIESGWWSAQWVIEDAGGGYVRLKNRWKNTYLHNEYGNLQTGRVDNGQWSAQWIIEEAGNGYVRFKNRWKGTYLHNQYGSLQLGNIANGWWSAQWKIQ
jgi:hypothetical protein